MRVPYRLRTDQGTVEVVRCRWWAHDWKPWAQNNLVRTCRKCGLTRSPGLPDRIVDPAPPTEPPPKPKSWPGGPTRVYRQSSPLPSIRFRLDIDGDVVMVTVEDQRDPRDWSAFSVPDGGVFVMNVTPDDLA